MGRGILKRKKQLKHQFLGSLQKELERVQQENRMLKTDPESVIGKFLNEFNAVVEQNQRLSALACALITQDGGKATVKKDEIEAFQGKRLRIKIETPDEVKLEEATEYVFTFTATTKEEDEAAAAVEAAARAAEQEIPPCTDPNCTLPKDLRHTHDQTADGGVAAATELTEASPELGEQAPELTEEASAGVADGQ